MKFKDIENLSGSGRSRVVDHDVATSAAGPAANEPSPSPGVEPAASSVHDPISAHPAGNPSVEDPTTATIGSTMAGARMAAGLSLDEVAAHLRIRRDFLEALETGREDALPGMTYGIGYVRTYAGYLGLDADDAVRRFKEEAAGLDRRTELVFPSPAPEGKVPGVGIMLASVVLAGMAYGGWYWMSERGLSVSDIVPEVPERLATLIEGTDGSGSSPSAAPTSVTATPPATAPVDYAAANPASAPVTARIDSGDPAASVPAGQTPSEGTVGPETAAQPTSAGVQPVETAAPIPATPDDAAIGAELETAAALPADQAVPSTAVPSTAAPGAAAVDQSDSEPDAAGPATVTAADDANTPVPTTDGAPAQASDGTDADTTVQVAATPPTLPSSIEPALAAAREAPPAGNDGRADPEPAPPIVSVATAMAAPVETAPAVAAVSPTTEPTGSDSATAVAAAPASVPSAPRLNEIIGASEAAVPAAPGTDRVGAIPERIVLRATGDSWVQIRGDDGTTLFTRVLRVGDVYRVPDRAGLTLATGNAGALDVIVDGETAPALGSFGEVVRNILLDPVRLSAGTAVGALN